VIGDAVCLDVNCSCIQELFVNVQIKPGQSCCNITPKISLDISCCVDSPDEAPDVCGESENTILETTRQCDDLTESVSSEKETCRGPGCPPALDAHFVDRIVIELESSCLDTVDCFCYMIHVTGTSACIDDVDVKEDCSTLVLDGGAPGDTVDFSIVQCTTVPVTHNLDFIWHWKICDGCECTCHPTIDVTYDIECVSCCCCPADEDFGLNVEGDGATIALDGGGDPDIEINDCGNGAGGSIVASWDICWLACPTFQLKEYSVDVFNNCSCPLTYRLQIVNNFNNFYTGQIDAGDFDSQTVSIFNDDTCDDCNCDDPTDRCDVVTYVMTVNWTPDPQCAYVDGGGEVPLTVLPEDFTLFGLPDDGNDCADWDIELSLIDEACENGVSGFSAFFRSGELGGGGDPCDIDLTFGDCTDCDGGGTDYFVTFEKVPSGSCTVTPYQRFIPCSSCASGVEELEIDTETLLFDDGSNCYIVADWSPVGCYTPP
jgi:hypothetical protein